MKCGFIPHVIALKTKEPPRLRSRSLALGGFINFIINDSTLFVKTTD